MYKEVWNWITHNGWYAIISKLNQTKPNRWIDRYVSTEINPLKYARFSPQQKTDCERKKENIFTINIVEHLSYLRKELNFQCYVFQDNSEQLRTF